MAKSKISATVSPELLEQARDLTGTTNVSQLLDDALRALIERHLEERWLERFSDEDLPGEIPVDWSHIPWED